MQMSSHHNNINMNMLKITACIAVVGLHTLQKDISLFNSVLYYLCGFAVPSFFMVGGYFLMNKTSVSMRYSLQKVLCILRIVILWELLYFLAKICQECFFHGDEEREFDFVEGVFGGLLQKGFFWQFWYLGALILLYIMLPVLAGISQESRLKLVIFLAGVMFGFYIFSVIRGEPVQRNVIQTFRLWTWIFYFVLGGLLRDYEKWWSEKIAFRLNIILLAVFTIFVLIYQNLVGRFVIHEGINGLSVLHAEYFYDSILMACWIIIIFMTFIRLPLSGSTFGLVSSLEGLTMGIYIVHPIIVRIYQRIIHPDTLFMSLFFFAMVLFTSAVIVWLIHKSPWGKYLIHL